MAKRGDKGDQGSDEKNSHCINCLIMRSNTGYWRIALLDMMKPHQQLQSLKSLLTFLISNARSALAASERGPNVNIYIDYTAVPAHLDLVNWRRVLIGLNLVLCEPDTNRDIQMIGVATSESSDSDLLYGFLVLLQSLYQLPWEVLQFIIYLNYKKASILYETLMDSTQGYSLPDVYVPIIKELYQANMEVMRKVGFYRTSADTPITWSRPHDDVKPALYSLHALYRNPVGVQEQSRPA